jgi:hypothetical protein
MPDYNKFEELVLKLRARAAYAVLSDDLYHKGWAVGYRRAADELERIVNAEKNALFCLGCRGCRGSNYVKCQVPGCPAPVMHLSNRCAIH